MFRELCVATGALTWFLISVAVICGVGLFLYEALGSAIMTHRVLQSNYRQGIEKASLNAKWAIWCRLFREGDRGSRRIQAEKVLWPRPWYDPEDDKEYYPG